MNPDPDLPDLIARLARPGAFPHPAGKVEVIQTHISVVFLAGPNVYKIKKPVDLGFLDFGTLDKRRHFCEEEVRLNRRLAGPVYLGVVPVAGTPDGLAFEAAGEHVEWAVKMRRLPEGASFEELLNAGKLARSDLERLARRLAEFHRTAASGSHISGYGRWDVVAGNARDNFTQSAGQVGTSVSRATFDRLRGLNEQTLGRLRPAIESRADRGVPRDCHGDLRLEHVYRLPGFGLPDDLALIDCIEFNEQFRYSDPVSDAAFLAMDLIIRGRRDLADRFIEEYFRTTGDDEGRRLIPFYIAYRSAVRAKVQGIKAAEAEIGDAERHRARERSRCHWLAALAELETPSRRPCLVLVSGLPGTGKSTLARGLATAEDFTVIRSDEVRKELASGAPGGTDIYAPEWTDRVYRGCLDRARQILADAGRVLIDANFRREWQRRLFLDAAPLWGVPAILLVCRATPENARARLASRTSDASDADWRTYQQLAGEWESPSPVPGRHTREIPCDGTPEETLRLALEALYDAGLAGHEAVGG